MNKEKLLNNLYLNYTDFKNTPLFIDGATSLVCGIGDYNSPIMFIGEAPGADEDKEKKPFVGRSGKLLTACIESFGVLRENVFITNIVKCRPPENRNPSPKEIKIGKTLILENEIQIINPKLIVALGSVALNGLLDSKYAITKTHGQIVKSKYGNIMPIYHPAYILRNMNLKSIFLKDIEAALNFSKIKLNACLLLIKLIYYT